MHVTVALRPADPTGLERLAAQVSTPGSALYRHFLRPRQVQEGFGPPAAVAAALRAWLRGRGLAAGPTSGDGLLLPATGSVAQVEAAFHTTIERVRLAGGRIAYMNRRAPRVPVRLRSWVTAVVGLNNLVLPQSELVSRSSPAGPRAAKAGPTAAKTCAAIRGIPAYTAGQLAHAYKFTALYRRGDSGQHVTVALFELADYSDQDIQAYSHCYRIDPPVRRVRVDGGTSIDANPGGTVEVTADIEVLAAMAPRAHVLVYEAPLSAGDATMDNYGAIAQQDRAQVVSSSWGGCEPLIGATDQRIEARMFQEMAIQGQSMMASAGDSGSEDCLPFVAYLPHRGYRLAVDDPGSQPFVTSVGGTMITTYRSPPAQSAWNQSPGGTGFLAPFNGQSRRPAGYPGNLVGGGGISRLWRMPSWQTGADHSGNASGASCGAPRGTDCREVPDVSALAAIGTSTTRGYVIYGTAGGFQNEGWLTVGGTSLASPLWASLTALADEQVTPHALGLLSPSLYRIARDDPRAFTDVTAGANDYLAVGGNPSNDTCRYDGLPDQPCYRATQGYDMATGLGSPEAKYLVADLRNLRDRRASGG
jgi:subtilase family serine protease